MRALATVALCSSLVLLALPAAAEPTAADKASAAADVQKATAAVNGKRFRAAAELFESAYKRAADPKMLFSAASAWQKNGDATRAANAYVRYLREAPEKAAARDKAKKELDALAPRLGQLVLKADGASSLSLDGDAVELPPPSVLYVNAGSHEIQAKFGEKTATQAASAPAGAITSVTLVAPADPRPPPPPVVAKVAPPPPRDDEKRKPLPPLVVYIGAGATVIAGGLTVLSALDTSSQKDTFDNERSQANLDAGKDKQLRTNILLAVTGGVAVLTGVAAILLVDWKGKSGENVKVGAGPGSLVLRSTF